MARVEHSHSHLPPLRRDLAAELREHGYRMTPQRLMVVAALQEVGEHFSAEDVHALARRTYPDLHISTVYRTFDLLEAEGFLTKTTGDFGDGLARYHLAERGHHHHLVCLECGAVIEVNESVLHLLEEVLLRDHGFQLDVEHLALHGRCARCRG